MKNVHYLLIGMLIIVLSFSACSSDDEIIIDQQNERVTTTVFGSILDENGLLLSNVLVELDGKTTSTNSEGVFLFKDVSIPADNSFLSVKKSGYFNGSRTFQPLKNSTNKIKITLMEKGTAIMVDGASGGEASLGDGSKIKLPSNGIKKEDGTIYTGMVNVYAKRLNQAQGNFEKMTLGNLVAEDLSENEVVLESFGMIVTELEGSGGEKLNIADGFEAEITLPLDAAVRNDAPTTIPLWHFDESRGIWIEEGIATLEGNKYVGKINHFSFWNCGAPFPTVEINGVISNNGSGLWNILMKMSRTNGSNIRPITYGHTSFVGGFRAKVPANEVILLEILDRCGEWTNTINIGPFATNSNLGVLDVDIFPNFTEIIGTANNCDGTIAHNVLVGIRILDNEEYYFIDGNNFTIPINYCSEVDDFEIKVIDFNNEVYSSWSTNPITPNTTNVEGILICNLFDEYISYQLDSEGIKVYSNVENSFPSGLQWTDHYVNAGGNDDNYIRYSMDLITWGAGVANERTFSLSSNNSGSSDFLIKDDGQLYELSEIQIKYNQINTLGELVEGYFSGQVRIPNTNMYKEVSGDIKMILRN